jgi:glycosyltransferase involved in cell wall biosynthesis
MLELGAPADRAAAIGNGVDIERFQPVGRVNARRKLGIPEDGEIVIAVGNLVPVKGHQFLISAIGQLVARHPKIRLYIVGEGESRGTLATMVGRAGLQDRILFAGRKPNEELKYWYSAADVSCLASSREGWANVLLESLACGTPVVATRVWGTPEIISSPDLGVLVDQTVDSIAGGLELALQKRWDRDFLARYAASRTWDVVAEEVENFLSARIHAQGQSVSQT